MTTHTMTPEQEIAYLREQIAKMRASQQGRLTPKVSAKGAVSVYGMGRWPVTLYRGQWERLFSAREQIEAFIEAHADELATKDDNRED